jgi:predicted AAA+ superfamily ATPase
MHGYIDRLVTADIVSDLRIFPAVAILGPRQAGKSSLAAHIAETQQVEPTIRLDLEDPRDRTKLTDPLLYFETHPNEMICIDEIQLMPELFPLLRSVIDRDKRPGRFLILGSASRELVNRSAESLAGRIAFQYLTPFMPTEYLSGEPPSILNTLLRGGFPPSALASGDEVSYRWREAFLSTYIQRDLPMLGLRSSAVATQRLLTMCAHLQGQVLNMAMLSASLGISGPTLRAHLDFLQEALLLRLLAPWSGNLRKRLVKSPKLSIRDSGLCHVLLGIRSVDDLMAHPVFGSSWEALCVETLCNSFPKAMPSYFRTSNGAEMDLVLEQGTKRVAVECKASTAPALTRGFYNACTDLQPDHTFVVCPIEDSYPIGESITACGLVECVSLVKAILS